MENSSIQSTSPATMAYSPPSNQGRQNSSASWVIFATSIIAYKLLLDISYLQVADAFQYQNFFFAVKTARTDLMSWAMLLISIPIFKKIFDSASLSGNILSLLIIFSVIPTICVFSYRSDYGLEYVALVSLYWILVFSAWFFSGSMHLPSLRSFQSELFYVAVAAALSLAVLTYSYLNTGLRLHFNVIEVYDIRAEARDFISPLGLNYVVSIADNILPVLAIFSLVYRRWLMFALLCGVIFINFSITGTKQLLFVPLLGIIGFYGLHDFSRTYRILAAAIALAMVCIAERSLLDSSFMHTLFTYRVLFIPAELHYSYFSYFQVHDLLYYSQSIFRLYASSTQENIQFVIGEYAIGDFTARANNGLFSDAYMNLGVVGILIYPFIIVAILRIIEGAFDGLPTRAAFVVVVYVAFVILGMTLTSALLTSGLLFLIVLLYSLPRKLRLAADFAPRVTPAKQS